MTVDARDLFLGHPIPKVKQHYEAMQKEKDLTSDELKANVYQNYPKFISTSKEIGSILKLCVSCFIELP